MSGQFSFLFAFGCSLLLLSACSVQQQQTTGSRNLVDPSALISGGPPKDGIPSIDSPKFFSVQESKWISDDADVFVIVGEKSVKIYPQPILVWHEIVNDEIDGMPIAVTYCPLCGSSIAYKRIVRGEPTTFGTTGKLYNSNLVMYDRKTDTYWTQIKGEAIIGKLTGTTLEQVPLQVMKWQKAQTRFKNALVLTKDTGFARPYGKDPYTDYYASETIYFPVNSTNGSLSAKAIVIGVMVNNDSKAYPEFKIKNEGTIDDTVGRVKLRIEMDIDGFLRITERETNKSIPWERDFWFAWVAFHPNTELFKQ